MFWHKFHIMQGPPQSKGGPTLHGEWRRYGAQYIMVFPFYEFLGTALIHRPDPLGPLFPSWAPVRRTGCTPLSWGLAWIILSNISRNNIFSASFKTKRTEIMWNSLILDKFKNQPNIDNTPLMTFLRNFRNFCKLSLKRL